MGKGMSTSAGVNSSKAWGSGREGRELEAGLTARNG